MRAMRYAPTWYSSFSQFPHYGKFLERMLKLALHVSMWSKCPEGRQHGCVIAKEGAYVVSTGYNGTGRGKPECDCKGEPKTYCAASCEAVHAEVNAVANAARIGVSVDGAIAFVTKAPCLQCLYVLRNAGIKFIAWSEGNDGMGFEPNRVLGL